MADDAVAGRVKIFTEPPIPTSSRYEKWLPIQAILDQLEVGRFFGATRLIRQMWRNPTLRVAFSTLFAGITSSEERWKAANDSPEAKYAAQVMPEDWPLIITTATREQQIKWGLLLGVNFAQPHWYDSPYSGRHIPRVELYDPSAGRWDDNRFRYILQTRHHGDQEVRSPSVSSPADLDPGWIVHEPFGKHSWREGYALSAAYAWLGNNLGRRDRLRSSEKVGEGTLLADVPHGADVKAATDFRDDLKGMKGGAVIVCETNVAQQGPEAKFNVRTLEWNAANGYQVVADSVAATNADLIILALGQDWSTTNKGGGSYAAVQGGLTVSAGYINRYAKGETDTLYHQVGRRWAEANFGDPDIAPIREVVADPPERDKAAAQMLVLMSQSLDNLVRHGADGRALMERFRLPLVVANATQVQVPPAPAPAPPAPPTPSSAAQLFDDDAKDSP